MTESQRRNLLLLLEDQKRARERRGGEMTESQRRNLLLLLEDQKRTIGKSFVDLTEYISGNQQSVTDACMAYGRLIGAAQTLVDLEPFVRDLLFCLQGEGE